ncbi:hypothetical protein C8J56DRAFT_788696 [Mycena floridula]|nr:hypothetical protein C8J56DRAFT_788696 [Mycena floridula]
MKKREKAIKIVSLTNKSLLKAIAAQIRCRTGRITILETCNPSTLSAKSLARSCLENRVPPTNHIEDLRISQDLVICGAKLANLMQARAYRLIHETKNIKTRRSTEHNLSLIQNAIQNLNNYSPTEGQIWNSIRHLDFLCRPRNFLYLAIHNGQKLGDFWFRIPECHDWGKCLFCDETESMQHILFECRRPGQTQLWNLAQMLWTKKRQPWPQMSLGLALRCGLAKFYNEDGRPSPGTMRLFRILVAETIHAIWKTRCNVVLKRNNKPVALAQIHNTWVRALNEHLKNDCFMTNQAQYGIRALNPDLVLRTWSGTLRDEDNLPDFWIKEPKVLVGIEPIIQQTQCGMHPRDHPGRNR